MIGSARVFVRLSESCARATYGCSSGPKPWNPASAPPRYIDS